MKAAYFFSPHLGEYIMQLQHVVPVDGRLLSEESLARRARMSKTTVEDHCRADKKGVEKHLYAYYAILRIYWEACQDSQVLPPDRFLRELHRSLEADHRLRHGD